MVWSDYNQKNIENKIEKEEKHVSRRQKIRTEVAFQCLKVVGVRKQRSWEKIPNARSGKEKTNTGTEWINLAMSAVNPCGSATSGFLISSQLWYLKL